MEPSSTNDDVTRERDTLSRRKPDNDESDDDYRSVAWMNLIVVPPMREPIKGGLYELDQTRICSV